MTQVIRKPPPDGMFSQSLPIWTRNASADISAGDFITQSVPAHLALTGISFGFPSSLADEEIETLGTTGRGILFAAILHTEGDVVLGPNEELSLYISCRATQTAQQFRFSNIALLNGKMAFLTPCTYISTAGDEMSLGAPTIPCPAGLRFFIQGETAIPPSSGLDNLRLWTWLAQEDVV